MDYMEKVDMLHGETFLKKGDKLYIYVGEQGTDAVKGRDSAATWNGGGLGTWDHADDETSGAGGGATDIRLTSGAWNDSISLASRIMVAGGGGGTSYTYIGGNGRRIKWNKSIWKSSCWNTNKWIFFWNRTKCIRNRR